MYKIKINHIPSPQQSSPLSDIPQVVTALSPASPAFGALRRQPDNRLNLHRGYKNKNNTPTLQPEGWGHTMGPMKLIATTLALISSATVIYALGFHAWPASAVIGLGVGIKFWRGPRGNDRTILIHDPSTGTIKAVEPDAATARFLKNR